jgi:hypothetical protein
VQLFPVVIVFELILNTACMYILGDFFTNSSGHPANVSMSLRAKRGPAAG